MFYTYLMETHHIPPAQLLADTYAVLRFGGAPPASAQAELGLSEPGVRWQETLFRLRPRGHGEEAMRPRFARDARHVAAVVRAGGYPALQP